MPSDVPTTHAAPATSGAGEGGADGLSVVKVTGQALAAITTAGAGAYIGGAGGTVVGAAFASIVTTVGDAFYQRSLERTRDHVKGRIGSRRPADDPDGRAAAEPGEERTTVTSRAGAPDDRPTTVAASAPGAATRVAVGAPQGGAHQGGVAHQPPPAADEAPTHRLTSEELARARAGGPVDPDATRVTPADDATQLTRADPDGTRVSPIDDATRRVGPPAAPPTRVDRASPDGGSDDRATQLVEAEPAARPSRKRYAVLAATAVLVFLVAMIAVTGIERVKGSPLSGGESGTSLGTVFGTQAPAATTTAPSGAEETTTSGAEPTATTSSGAEATSTEPPAGEEAPTTTSGSRSRVLPSELPLPGN